MKVCEWGWGGGAAVRSRAVKSSLRLSWWQLAVLFSSYIPI